MSTITNEPILLDATGRAMLEKMDRQNAYLAMIAEGRRKDIYSSISQVAGLVRGNSVEENQKIFPIGDQIVIPWKDVDDSAHNTDETAYQVPLDIVHHGEVTLESGEVVSGMFVQWHYCSPYGVQFSHQQAFLNCTDGLAAGTYYVTFGGSWGSKGAEAGTSWSFTLTKAIPAGGRLSGFEGLPDVAPSAFKVKSWSTPNDAAPLEEVSVVSGENGTFLGTMNLNNLGTEGLNSMQCAGYGHNRWKTSALRQYLNKSGTEWWESKEDFDIRPDQYTKHGFMDGFTEEFLAAVKPVKVMTALNTVEGFTETVDETFDRFFLPSLEQMNVVPQLAGVEGEYFEYWRRRLGVTAPVAQYGTYPNLITTAINAKTSPQYVRLRSAYRFNACGAWGVSASGYVYDGGASTASRFSPVCVIC